MLEVTVGQMSDYNFLIHMAGLFYICIILPKFQKPFTHCFNTKQIFHYALCSVLTQGYFLIVIQDAASDQTCASSAKDLQLLVENFALMRLPAVICIGTCVKLYCACTIACTFVKT